MTSLWDRLESALKSLSKAAEAVDDLQDDDGEPVSLDSLKRIHGHIDDVRSELEEAMSMTY